MIDRLHAPEMGIFDPLPPGCEIRPRNSCTRTAQPVSSMTSRLAAAIGSSFGLSLPFGRTHALSLRR
jgi:hypothetical protein